METFSLEHGCISMSYCSSFHITTYFKMIRYKIFMKVWMTLRACLGLRFRASKELLGSKKYFQRKNGSVGFLLTKYFLSSQTLKHAFSHKLEFQAIDQMHMKWKRRAAVLFNENNNIAKNIQNSSHIYNITDIYTNFFSCLAPPPWIWELVSPIACLWKLHIAVSLIFLLISIYNLVLWRVKERKRDESLKFLATKIMTKRSCLYIERKKKTYHGEFMDWKWEREPRIENESEFLAFCLLIERERRKYEQERRKYEWGRYGLSGFFYFAFFFFFFDVSKVCLFCIFTCSTSLHMYRSHIT